MRHRLKLENPSRVANESGGWVTTYTELATVWASAEQLSGARALDAGVPINATSYRFLIWKNDGIVITRETRLVYKNKEFAIASFKDIEERGVNFEIIARGKE